jgi:hypothetical protein
MISEISELNKRPRCPNCQHIEMELDTNRSPEYTGTGFWYNCLQCHRTGNAIWTTSDLPVEEERHQRRYSTDMKTSVRDCLWPFLSWMHTTMEANYIICYHRWVQLWQ